MWDSDFPKKTQEMSVWAAWLRGGTTEIVFVILTYTIFYILYFIFLQAQRSSNASEERGYEKRKGADTPFCHIMKLKCC